MQRCSTAPANTTAQNALSSLSAVRILRRGRCRAPRDMARQIAKSREGRTSRRLRKKVEMLFAHLKRIIKLDRFRLRGPNGARDEFLLAARAQNRCRASSQPKRAKQGRSTQCAYDRARSDSIAARLVQQNRPKASFGAQLLTYRERRSECLVARRNFDGQRCRVADFCTQPRREGEC